MSVERPSIYAPPVPKMPPGLVELMEGLAKDVLKCNPPDMYSFCADHMKKLLEIRDGTPPKQVLTLEQKTDIAIKKIRARAACRRENYDKKKQMFNEQECQDIKNYENNINIKNSSESPHNVKDKIVNISEADLVVNPEHEIIADSEEQSLIHNADHEEINAESKLTTIKSIDISLPTSLQKSDTTSFEKDCSITNENNYSNETNNEMQENLTDENEKENIKMIQIESQVDNKHDAASTDEEICFELLKNENNSENQISTAGLVKSNDNIKDCENADNIQKQDDNLNSTIENDVLTVVDEQKNTNDIKEKVEVFDNDTDVIRTFGEKKDILDYSTEETSNTTEENKERLDLSSEGSPDVDKTALNISNIAEDENINKDQIYLNFHEAQHDNITLKTPSTLLEEDEELNSSKFELENHVTNSTMDLETAAITIQKVFRNFLFKNKTLSSEDATNVDINSFIGDNVEKGVNDTLSMHINKDRRTLGLSRMDTVLQTVNEEKSLSQSTDDSSTLSSAATIIQAHVRGYLTRNKLNTNKNSSTTSGVDSDGLSFTSLEGDNDNRKNKTVLNIHIVPESSNFLSRDESVLTSIDLSMDGSPPCSTNLHPLGYDRSERRKQLKREDAFQSTSPPSNNSGKLSEDVDSVKEILITENPSKVDTDNARRDAKDIAQNMFDVINISTMVDCLDSALEVKSLGPFESPEKHEINRPQSMPEFNTDEMDVITPFNPLEAKFYNKSNLIHSGEFHDVVLPTQVSRSDTAVVREFQNVLVYFLLWNNA